MDVGQIAAVGEIEFLRSIFLVKLGGILAQQRAGWKMSPHESRELFQTSIRTERSINYGDAQRRWMLHAMHQSFKRLVGRLGAILFIEATQVEPPFLVGEAGQISVSSRIVPILEDGRRGARNTEAVVI